MVKTRLSRRRPDRDGEPDGPVDTLDGINNIIQLGSMAIFTEMVRGSLNGVKTNTSTFLIPLPFFNGLDSKMVKSLIILNMSKVEIIEAIWKQTR